MAERTVTLRLIDETHVVPDFAKGDLERGDFVRYVTEPPDRPFRVVFEGDPFTNQAAFTISDSERREVKVNGKFFCKCFMKNAAGVEVGWLPFEDPESGGEHDIRP